MTVLKTTCIDAMKSDPDLTVAGYVNEMVGARVNLDSISDDVFKELLTTAFKGSPADGYITQVLNTDGIPVQTIVQGLIDRSEGLHNESVVAKANKAIQQIEEVIRPSSARCSARTFVIVSEIHSDRQTSGAGPSRCATTAAAMAIMIPKLAAGSCRSAIGVARLATGRTTARLA